MDSLVDKLRAAIEAGDRGPICADDGTWETSPSQPFAAAHRKILEAWESGERAAAMDGPPGFTRELFGRQQVLKYILEALAEAYDITVEEPA